MSLLMDALKQAEHAKRGNKQDSKPAVSDTQTHAEPVTPAATEQKAASGAAPQLSLAPVEAPASPSQDVAHFDDLPALEAESAAPTAQPIPVQNLRSGAAPEETAELSPSPAPEADSTDTEQAATPPTEMPAAETVPVPSSVEARSESARVAARLLAASEARIASQQRLQRLSLIGLGVVTLLGLAGYHYWATLQHTATPPPLAALPDTAVDSSGDTGQDVTAPVLAESDTPPAATESATPKPTPWRNGPAPQTAEPDWEGAPVDARALRGELPPPEPDSTSAPATPRASIRITRSTRSDRVSDNLQTAYLDYQAGRYPQAAAGYREVLATEPANRDARLGLAALALLRGEIETARALYAELLHQDPKDSAAQAGLASLQSQPSAATESELKLLIAEQPQAAQLHFALANLYAGQARWALAQQAYFDAQRLAPEQPDYAFNLAISLEHLGQPRAALDYYRRALGLAVRRPASFDVASAEQRIQALQRVAQP